MSKPRLYGTAMKVPKKNDERWRRKHVCAMKQTDAESSRKGEKMTYEEALKTLEDKYIGIGSNDVLVFRKAAEAINKQIPKKVVREAGEILYSCPNNRLHQMTVDKKGEFRYCSICGQALDWSDENDT